MKHIFIFSACSMMALSSLSAGLNYNTNPANNNSNNSNSSFQYNNSNNNQNSNSNNNFNNAGTNNSHGYTTIQSDLNDATAAEARQNAYNNQPQSLATIEAQVNQQKTAAQPASATTKTTTTTTTATDASKGGAFVSDQDLTKAIYKAIRDDRMFTGDSKIKVQVTVYNGKVTLSGEVATEAEKARAELLANQVNKLHGVTNNIKVVR